MIQGLPEVVAAFAGFDQIGCRTRIAPDVTVMRYGDVRRTSLGAGDDCVIHTGVRFVLGDTAQHPATGVEIGHRVHVNAGCYLSGEGGLRIGDDVLIGPHAKILSAGHEIDGGQRRISDAPLTYGPISIGCGAWIGAGAIVLDGVTIGDGAVVAAGAVVTRSIPSFAVCAGTPARVLRYRKDFDPETRPAKQERMALLGRLFRRFSDR